VIYTLAAWGLLAGLAGSVSVIYAQATLGVGVGIVVALWGWNFVKHIGDAPPKLELTTRHGWRDINRYRRR
jgi:hypothetical protein